MNRPRRALLLDTETTGLDPKTDHIIEVGCILYDLAVGSPIASFSALARGDSNAAEHINGIPVSLLAEAFEQERLWVGVCDLMAHADVVLAHRAEFDRSFVEADPGYQEMARSEPKKVPWVCTKFHIAWPDVKSGEHLVHLALAYGVGVLGAHRAMTDVDIMARIFTRLKERGVDLQKLVGDAMVPRVKMQALVSFEQKDLAKAAGFSWEPGTKRWLRDCLPDEKFNFKTKAVL